MLPVANRMPISLALLLPGTSMNNLSGRRPTATIGAGGGNGGQMNLYYADGGMNRSEEHTSELQSHHDLVCRLLLEKKKMLTHPNQDNQSTVVDVRSRYDVREALE